MSNPTRPVGGPANWLGGAISDDRWCIELDARQVAELRAAVTAVAPLAPTAITAADVELPTLAPVLAGVVDDLVDGRGFVLLRGMPVEAMTAGELERLFWCIGIHLGIPIAQNDAGDVLVHVRDEGLDFTDPTVRAYQTNDVLGYHSDSSDVVGLLCVRPAMEGGVSTIVSAAAVYSAALAARPDLADVLGSSWWWDRRKPDLDASFFQRRIFAIDDEGRFASYYGRSHIESAVRGPQVPDLDGRQIEALDLLDSLANDPRFVLNMHFRPGDIQFLNNYKIWHARTSYVDFPEPERQRDLYRLWLTLRVPMDLPEDFRHGGITEREVAFGMTNGDVNLWGEPITFAATWSRAVAARGDATFLLFQGPDGSTTAWTYAEFDAVVARAAAHLTGHGVTAGSSVHLALTNSPAFVALWIATARLGGWIVPSDPMGTTPELAGHIERTAPAVGFCATTRAGVYRAAAPAGLPVVEIDEADTVLAGFGTAVHAVWAEPTLRDRAAVMFTSGTTGRPKGVDITQANYAFAGATMAAACGLAAEHRQLVVLPMFHANAQFYSFASAIAVGASVAMMHTFSASRFLEQARDHVATHASLFAAPIRMILSRATAPAAPVGLQHCWYAMNITDTQHETLGSWLGCRPRQLYGMTETLPAVLTEPATDPRPDSMGMVTPGCLVEIHDGEIVVGGEPGITLFAGYLDDPATTAASFAGGWFATGDRATLAPDGRFLFDGRRSDVLKVAGENVSTVEVEQVIGAFPGVLEVAVVGQPDEVRDEVPVAFVVAESADHPPSIDDLHEWCAQRLTKSKRPRDITLVEKLPRTSVGKIRKFLLREPTPSESLMVLPDGSSNDESEAGQ